MSCVFLVLSLLIMSNKNFMNTAPEVINACKNAIYTQIFVVLNETEEFFWINN